jgi:hypothetical protein
MHGTLGGNQGGAGGGPLFPVDQRAAESAWSAR